MNKPKKNKCLTESKKHIWMRYVDRHHIQHGRICQVCGYIDFGKDVDGSALPEVTDYD